MRITGGLARGIRLQTPAGKSTRPATDQMREAVFSSLAAHINGAIVADWFAGTGAYGLEALSRGACHCTFVESDPRALDCLKQNLHALAHNLQQPPQMLAKVESRDLLAPPRPSERMLNAAVVFADPPYEELDLHWQTISDRIRSSAIAAEGLLIFEVPGDFQREAKGWEILKRLGKAHRGKPNVLIMRPLSEMA